MLQTFLANSLPLERAVVFAMVGAHAGQPGDTFSLKEIDEELERRGLSANFGTLDEACRNLVTASILQKSGKQFTFSIPLFARMLEENYPVDYAFEKTRREIIPAEVSR
jgi:hypothetical protein